MKEIIYQPALLCKFRETFLIYRTHPAQVRSTYVLSALWASITDIARGMHRFTTLVSTLSCSHYVKQQSFVTFTQYSPCCSCLLAFSKESKIFSKLLSQYRYRYAVPRIGNSRTAYPRPVPRRIPMRWRNLPGKCPNLAKTKSGNNSPCDKTAVFLELDTEVHACTWISTESYPFYLEK